MPVSVWFRCPRAKAAGKRRRKDL